MRVRCSKSPVIFYHIEQCARFLHYMRTKIKYKISSRCSFRWRSTRFNICHVILSLLELRTMQTSRCVGPRLPILAAPKYLLQNSNNLLQPSHRDTFHRLRISVWNFRRTRTAGVFFSPYMQHMITTHSTLTEFKHRDIPTSQFLASAFLNGSKFQKNLIWKYFNFETFATTP